MSKSTHYSEQQTTRRRIVLSRLNVWSMLLPLLVLAPLGCSTDAGGDGDGTDGGTDGGTIDGVTTVKVPDGFPPAARVTFDEVNRLIVDGSIEVADEVVVYDLGALAIGDRVDVRCIARSGSNLDIMIALFDVDGLRIFWNDDINPDTNNFDAAFDGFIRHNSENYFLAVASTNFLSTTGGFRCTVQLDAGVGVAPVIGQTVVLRFAESEGINIAGIDYDDLPAFDAANINAGFDGDTEALQGIIVGLVEEDYAAFDLNLVTSDDQTPEENFSTIFFGVGTAQNIFGIADGIDFYNGSDMDNAIVFLESFSGLTSSLQGLAQAISNVVSHEIGHTLGLMHTDDATTLMDTRGSDASLLVDQSFGTADLVDFPIGRQDAPSLLEETIGRATAKTSSESVSDGYWRCGTCGATIALVTGAAGLSND